jgi:hypothetical protein
LAISSKMRCFEHDIIRDTENSFLDGSLGWKSKQAGWSSPHFSHFNPLFSVRNQLESCWRGSQTPDLLLNQALMPERYLSSTDR